MARRPVLGDEKAPTAPREPSSLPARVRTMAAIAWAILLAERLWAALAPAVSVVLLALALAWLGLPRDLGVWIHVVLLIVAAAGFLYALWWGFRRFRLPAWQQALRRLERDSDLTHRPLTHIDDTQVSNLIDPAAASLWARHRARLLASIGRLDLKWPDSGLVARDRYALRQLALLLAVAAFFSADEAWLRRLDQALLPNFSGIEDSDQITVEAWITPPDYTGLPPISLSLAQKDAAAETLKVPKGSRLLVQAQGLPTSGMGGPATLVANDEKLTFDVLDASTQRSEATLSAGRMIGVQSGLATVVEWPVEIIADMAPKAAFGGNPGITDRGVLRLGYSASDDYGVTDLRLVMSRGTEDFEFKLPLGQATLGPDGQRVAQGGSFQDFTAHRWAGLDVELRLVARDAMGQIGASAPLALTLPERKFYHPVARAIIELRKRLASDWQFHNSISRELDILKSQPETYEDRIVAFMGMDFAARRLRAAEFAPSDTPPVLQLMWDIAVDLEDGGTSLALSEFRRLQQALQDALDRGASDEEIERLMNQLQEAMNHYMQDLQQQLQRAMESGQQMRQLSPNGLKLSQQDLNQMLNDARNMARSGAKDSAKQMLDQLQKLMENLQAGVPSTMSAEGRAQQELNSELGRLMQRQQKLLEDSYNAQRGQQPGEQGMGEGEMGQGENQGEGMPGDGGNGQAPGSGAMGQEQLRRDLGNLMQQYSNMLGDLPGGLGKAEQYMRGAVDSLQNQDFPSAAENQNNALNQLQQGLQAAQEMMQRQAGQMPGRGTRPKMDPLGRPADDDGPGGNPIDSSGMDLGIAKEPAQKAREIFEELRQRRNDPSRPKPERDYLDRLLKQF
ncbi:TIGR02302 family protein [Dongia rigui]|uniref:TIGR02302 family protein n=1 Tax=Dongia rigui TaxID=940149 RepID=A0ABU5E1P6_9PROT|nr:TIGR02302 family protein [Dongia rigui]MDY0873516.1 TIGR02302 family protein [Dongia rigui]